MIEVTLILKRMTTSIKAKLNKRDRHKTNLVPNYIINRHAEYETDMKVPKLTIKVIRYGSTDGLKDEQAYHNCIIVISRIVL